MQAAAQMALKTLLLSAGMGACMGAGGVVMHSMLQATWQSVTASPPHHALLQATGGL